MAQRSLRLLATIDGGSLLPKMLSASGNEGMKDTDKDEKDEAAEDARAYCA